MPMHIRRAEESDGAQLIELKRKLNQETSNMLWEPDEFTQTTEDETKRIARFHGRPNGLVVVAEDDGAAVGVLTAAGGEVRRLRHSAHLALGVARSHWGKGVATRIWSSLSPGQQVSASHAWN